MTFFTLPRRCLAASLPSVNLPVDSTTICAPRPGKSISAGSLLAKIRIFFWPTMNGIALRLYRFAQRSQNRIVFQQMRQRFGIGQIVGRDELDIRIVQRGPQHISANAPEPVDANFYRHKLQFTPQAPPPVSPAHPPFPARSESRYPRGGCARGPLRYRWRRSAPYRRSRRSTCARAGRRI